MSDWRDRRGEEWGEERQKRRTGAIKTWRIERKERLISREQEEKEKWDTKWENKTRKKERKKKRVKSRVGREDTVHTQRKKERGLTRTRRSRREGFKGGGRGKERDRGHELSRLQYLLYLLSREIWKCFAVTSVCMISVKMISWCWHFKNTTVGDYTVALLLLPTEKTHREKWNETDSVFLCCHRSAWPQCSLIHHFVAFLLLLLINLLILQSIKCQKICLYVSSTSCLVFFCEICIMCMSRNYNLSLT